MRDYAALVDQALDLVRFVDKYAGLIGADLVEFFRTSSPSSSSSTSTDANGDEGIGWLSVPAAWRAEWARDPTSPAIVSLLRSAPGSGCTADVGSLWSPEQRELPETAARLAFQRTVDFGQLEGGAAIVTLDEMFTLGMKEKKQHEVMVMAAVIDSIAKRRGIATVVDLGAGMAHLSNMLAFHYGLNVIAVDNDTKQTAGALTRQANIEKRIAAKARRTGEKIVVGKVKHITADILASGWNEVVEEALTDMLAPTESRGWMLCGLHTCGDLACSTLRKFVTGNASVVVNVGCCYQWLTETAVLDTYSELSSLGSRTVDNPNHHRDDDASDAESGRLYGFPLSQALTNASASLGRKARGLANQSLDRWPESQADLDSLFTRHFYRAALQIILDEFVTSPRNDAQTKWTPILGALPAGAHASFVTYCHAALDKLGVRDQVTDDQAMEVHDRLLPRKGQVAIFWRLRCELTVVENIILLDRMLYLQEQGMQVKMLPIFDASISPRNVVIIGER